MKRTAVGKNLRQLGNSFDENLNLNEDFPEVF
jgi:hypothetical protein